MKFIILISLLFIILISGCGDNGIRMFDPISDSTNDSSASASASPSPQSQTPQITYNPVDFYQTISNFETFKVKVRDGQFIKKTIFDDVTDVSYDMTEFRDENSNIGSFFREENLDSEIIKHENGSFDSSYQASRLSIVSHFNDILDHVNTLDGYTYMGGASFKVSDSRNGNTYTIDLNEPIVANPVYYFNKKDNGGYKLYYSYYY